MKIAVFHNYLDNIGGAEIVSLILSRELGADIFTTNFSREKIEKMGFNTDRIYSIGNIPINAPLRQEAAYWKFRKLDLGRKYDFYIIAGDWAMPAAIHNSPNLWYVHSPTREIWDLYEYTRNNIVPPRSRLLFDAWVAFRRHMNRTDAKKIQKVLCNSVNVKGRVKKYLNIDAQVAYPPTETKKYYYKKNGNFWLSVNRLINHKRVEMQLKAFKMLPNERLVIAGSYEEARHFTEYARELEKIRPANVVIKNWVEQKELNELYATCKGFITTSMDEDYGMTPVEAMASGKAVIAPNEGGYKETILPGKTGVLIDDINEHKLTEAVLNLKKNIENEPFELKNACLARAKEFDTENFILKIKKTIGWLA